MADLVTHACLALLIKAPTQRKHVASFVAGTLLPDLLARLPPMALQRVAQALDWPIGPGWSLFFAPFHLPAGMLLLSLLLAQLFARGQRRGVGLNLLMGMLLHIGVDLLQDHGGFGYMLLFPVWDRSFELPIMGSEATVWVAPALGVATAWAWRRSGRGQPPPVAHR